MKRKLKITAALATTASVALLAGAAHAQMSGAPQVCTTTQISPAHQDCVMPTASAPGGGSFPGSFLVPGTNTSLAFHGFIQVDINHDIGPHYGDGTFGGSGTVLDSGPGVPAPAAHSLNGGTNYDVKNTRPDIETRTPTAYGSLITYIEFDWNQANGPIFSGGSDTFRLRMAYGTLGPWLIGQTNSLFFDGQSAEDTVNGILDPGIMNPGNLRRPQVRYTWLGGNGFTIAGSLEQPQYQGNQVFSHATDGVAFPASNYSPIDASTGNNGELTGTSAYYNWPMAALAAEWDQPWGHVRFAVAGGDNQIRQARTGTAGVGVGPNIQYPGYVFGLTGHLNTWGKDALRGGVSFNKGAAAFSSDMPQGGLLLNDSNGSTAIVKEWTAYASYEHFFNGQWRANEAFGYAHNSGNPFSGACTNGVVCTQGGIDQVHFGNNLNVIYSPVPQTDFVTEWEHYYRKVVSGASGTADRIQETFKFYF